MLFHVCLLCFLFVLCTAAEDPYFLISANEKNNRDAYFNNRLTSEKYQPTWESLDSRPLPSWYDDAKLGIFIHWGVFSVPSFGSEWFWKYWKDGNSVKYQNFMKERYPPNFTYQDFARDFTAEFYNASQWTELFEAAGAKYVVLTSKHHEGYTLWPSTHSFSWNAMDVGPHRDLLGELAEAIKSSSNIKFGLYHSLYEWYNPMYLNDKKNHFASNNFVTDKIMPELHELVEKYRPEVIWSDGDWEATDSYWTSKEFLAWLYNKSPVKDTIVVNDRWGTNIPCHHGDFYTCSDRYNPGVLQSHKWENCMTIDKMSWGFRRNAVLADYMTLKELVKELVVTVSCGGNLLMNIGPSKDGLILPVFEERLRGMGQWLSINGEAIYGTKPWTVQNDTITGTVWYTQSKYENSLYVHVLDWPKDSVLYLGSVKVPDNTKIHLLGYPNALKWEQGLNKLTIQLPDEAHRGQAAWVLKIQEGPQYK